MAFSSLIVLCWILASVGRCASASEAADHAEQHVTHHDEHQTTHELHGEDHHEEGDHHDGEGVHSEVGDQEHSGEKHHHDETHHDEHHGEAGNREHNDHKHHTDHGDHEQHEAGDQDHNDEKHYDHAGHADHDEHHDDGHHIVIPTGSKTGAGAVASASTGASASGGNWGVVLLGSFITCLPTLLGVLFAACVAMPNLQKLAQTCEVSFDSFASGVLFAAAVFLLLPEALHLASAGHDDEVVGTWTWGTSMLLGWLTCTLIHHLCSVFFAKPEAKGEVDIEKNTQTEPANWMAIAGPVLFGDFFHNLSDGFVLAAAFQNCSSSFAWKLVAVCVAHELPQEIGDFFVLINDAGLKWQWATLANFLSSLSTMIGAVIGYGYTIGPNEQGCILAYGAGVYLFIAMTELGAKVAHLPQADVTSMAKRLVPFAVGCIGIGLVLLSHEHCQSSAGSAGASASGAAAGSHAGHAH